MMICVMLFDNTLLHAQIERDSSKPKPTDTGNIVRTVQKATHDSLKKISPPIAGTKTNQQNAVKKDSAQIIITADSQHLAGQIANYDSATIAQPPKAYRDITAEILVKNKFINVKDKPVYFVTETRQPKGKEFLFYALCIVILILGLFKTFYSQYFNNLFRVFFNTSLRQTQLTDQLMQAKLPSFILNIFFTLTAGMYIWILFIHFHPPRLINSRILLPFCIVSVAIIYFSKFCLLKFMGWVSDIRQATDNYIFVLFLVNKITGILLVPFVILLAFAMPQWVNAITTVSLLVLGLFFLSRYVKSYGVIERKLPINPLHFLIYILGAEIAPLMIIYKVAMDYLI